MNIALLTSGSDTYFRPGRPGSPNYKGAKDYPFSVYPGYPGSQRYVWEPGSTGFPFIDSSKVQEPVAVFPDKKEIKKEVGLTNLLFGECNIPSYFVERENTIEKCTKQWSFTVFNILLIVNIIISFIYIKSWTRMFIIWFITFHLILYYIITRIYVNISMTEWSMTQNYKSSIKIDADVSKYDTTVQQFNVLTRWLKEQPITRQNILIGLLLSSIIFIWLPLVINLFNVEHKKEERNNIIS